MELFLLIQQLSHHLQLLPQKHSDLCSLQEGWVEFDQGRWETFCLQKALAG